MPPMMSPPEWAEVDAYFAGKLAPPDAVLDAALKSSATAGLPSINVAPNQGKLLQILARLCNANRILEVGTLGGYSTIWLATALPLTGKLVTLEVEKRHAEVARANIVRAGLDRKVEIRVGRALETLGQMVEEGTAPFDLVFIDADKPNNAEYFKLALKLSHKGTLIIVDNVVRNGAVADAASRDASVQGTRRMFDLLESDPRVSATAIQTVGSKGYDGFAIALVTGEA